MTVSGNQEDLASVKSDFNQRWLGPLEEVVFEPEEMRSILLQFEKACFAVRTGDGVGLATTGRPDWTTEQKPGSSALVGIVPAFRPQQLGDPQFSAAYKLDYAYAAGAMANGIASEEHVIALGKRKMLSSFGAAGLLPGRIETAIRRIQTELGEGPYAFNLIHSPSEETLERRAVELYLQYGVKTVEASAYLALTPHVVRYRAAGLELDRQGQTQIKNKVIAKISRREVARQFMQPAPPEILRSLVESGLLTPLQARLAEKVPVADDITVEADSGGHTDNRPLVCLLPSMLELSDEIQARYAYEKPVRVGAGGGIGTPQAVLAAFMMGAAYVVTGSINQACLEAGTSAHTKKLLSQAEMPDVMMAPAADMFEAGVKVQLLKRGTLFPMRASRLYELYRQYEALEEIPQVEREKLERQIFRKPLEAVWQETISFFKERDPSQIERAAENPKRKMALIFRWYLGLSSRWSNSGEKSREMDYQIWCGPAMGAFNDWVRGSYLEDPANRHVGDVAEQLMRGATYLYRVQNLNAQGVSLPVELRAYRPVKA
ncbi:MAG TPA: PfaD family polyunsaturated fatty acid/polyketide biosynthesis protein [Chloroflexia bacterium]|nr:PfaD family polyunsaturated fatty acid/polyketide biosynthesis protein [Chloroflexia bacterium]